MATSFDENAMRVDKNFANIPHLTSVETQTPKGCHFLDQRVFNEMHEGLHISVTSKWYNLACTG